MGPSRITILYLASLFTCCVAPICYSCDQSIEGCGDHFSLPNTQHSAYCDGTCVKRRGERYSNSVRIVEVSRTCIAQRDKGCYDTTWNGISVRACACNTDYCNGGERIHSAPRTVLAQLALGTIVCLIHTFLHF